jgi:molecular chaperone HscB
MYESSLFACFDLPISFSLNETDLHKAYLTQIRACHPDALQTGDDEQADASRRIAEINVAYMTLKDPLRRAEHLADVLGVPAASVSREMPAEFLNEVLELREEIAELDSPESPQGQNLLQRLRSQRNALIGQIGTLIHRMLQDNASDESRRNLRLMINQLRYLEGLVRDLQT